MCDLYFHTLVSRTPPGTATTAGALVWRQSTVASLLGETVAELMRPIWASTVKSPLWTGDQCHCHQETQALASARAALAVKTPSPHVDKAMPTTRLESSTFLHTRHASTAIFHLQEKV